MYRYNNSSRHPRQIISRRRQAFRHSLKLTCFTLLLTITLATFICAIIATIVSQTAFLVALRPPTIRTSLPTFTPTSLPTLIPTPVAAQSVMALSTTAVDNAVLPPSSPTTIPTPLPTPVNDYVTPPSVAGNQNNSQPTLTSRVTLNVRSGPGLDYNVVGKLADGQSAAITGQNPDGSWWQIEYPSGSGGQAWVSADPQYSTVSQTMPQTIAQASTPTSPPVAPAVTATDPPLTTVPPTPTLAPVASGWSFSGVTSLAGNSEEGLLLMGELVNGTGAPQQVIDISGAFYDAQGQVAEDILDLVSYVPVDPVPANAHVPFYLQVNGRQDIDHFDLSALSEPASDPPRQDFQLSGIEQWVGDTTGYCIRGQVDNQGPPLQEYLIVVAIGYDGQGSVVNFGEYYVDPLPGSNGQGSPFEMCLDPLSRQISRHDLIAFGD